VARFDLIADTIQTVWEEAQLLLGRSGGGQNAIETTPAPIVEICRGERRLAAGISESTMFEINQCAKILAIAYACEPGNGSEPGAGWIWSCMLACLGETWIITRSTNRSAIEEGLRSLSPDVSPRFVYVDLPEWARFWKRGQRGIRLYYLLWQIAALRKAHQLLRQLDFDLVWHLTLANAWLGSTGSLLRRPFVYGPSPRARACHGGSWLVPALGIWGRSTRAFAKLQRPRVATSIPWPGSPGGEPG
jgi:hypothetical protein